MKRKPRAADPRDGDGVHVVDERGAMRRRLPWIVVLVLAVPAAWLVLTDAKRPPSTAERKARDVAGTETAPASARRFAATTGGAQPSPKVAKRSVRVVRTDATPRGYDSADARTGADVAHDGGVPDISARDYIEALRESGETTGLAAFPPPGTRPPRSGLIVPADYDLPEGFARHYQSTDDGQLLAPILVVAPGYELVDESGSRVPLPDDRIVPPELAPPDLPVHMLDVPGARDAGDDSP